MEKVILAPYCAAIEGGERVLSIGREVAVGFSRFLE